jgi:RNA polymerase sigma factor (sigma-70 family)
MLGCDEPSGEYDVMANPSRDARVARFESFYEAHYLEISGYVRRRTADHEAGDVVGQIFMVAWRRLDRIPSPPEDRLWLFGVARRCVADSRRSTLRRLRLHTRLAQQPLPAAPLSEEDDAAHVRIRTAMSNLRPSDREVLQLVLWEELSHYEAATVLGCSVNAVEIRYRRARQRLRGALAEASADVEYLAPESAVASETWRIRPS